MQKIIEITGGAVQLADFLDPKPPECATVVTLPNGKTRLVFPWSRDDDLERSMAVLRTEPKEWEQFTPPIRQALADLGPNARILPDGLFEVRRVKMDAGRLVDMANRIRRIHNRPLIEYPERGEGSKS